jgi:hypothetical protein
LIDQHHGVTVGHPEAGVRTLEGTPIRDLDSSQIKPASAGNRTRRSVLEQVPQVVLILPVRRHRGDDGHWRCVFPAEHVGGQPDAVAHRDHDFFDEDVLGERIFDEIEGMIVQVVSLALGREARALEFPV